MSLFRYGLVQRPLNLTAELVATYLPSNYRVLAEVRYPPYKGAEDETMVVIVGRDRHSWTLDRYIIPRLGTGMMRCDEIDLSHPVMKQIPDDA